MKNVLLSIVLTAIMLLGISFISTTTSSPPNTQTTDPFIGEVAMFAGTFAPRGWAFCDGQLLAIAEHQALFSLLGTTYGGDGRTTFALPDLRGRVPMHVGQSQGPGLSQYTLGQKSGQETSSLETGSSDAVSLRLAESADPSDKKFQVSKNPNNLQPYLGVNYIIALQGIYPSRN